MSNMNEIKVEAVVDGSEYTATYGGDRFGTLRVIISADGVWAGQGRWDGYRIADCPATLPEEAYQALDAALLAAMAA